MVMLAFKFLFYANKLVFKVQLPKANIGNLIPERFPNDFFPFLLLKGFVCGFC